MKKHHLRFFIVFLSLIQCTHAPHRVAGTNGQGYSTSRTPSQAENSRQEQDSGRRARSFVADSDDRANFSNDNRPVGESLDGADASNLSLDPLEKSVNPQLLAAIDNVIGEPTTGQDWLMALPGDPVPYMNWIRRELSAKRYRLTDDELNYYVPRVAKYIAFLIFRSQENEQARMKLADAILTRLLRGSTQFLFCPNLDDLACLEKIPRLTPTADFRVEDPKGNFHEVLVRNEALEPRLKWFFNRQIFVEEEKFDPKIGVANQLRSIIESVPPKPGNGIWMALYGIDDISNDRNFAGNKVGSLAPVYNALLGQKNRGVDIYGVFDHNGPHPNVPRDQKLLFSYVEPQTAPETSEQSPDQNPGPSDGLTSEKLASETEPDWIFSPLKTPVVDKVTKRTMSGFTNLAFMYNGGSQGIITELNRGITKESEARARLEWPNRGIMHNKFFIFKNGANKSVWTGTANISRTCMGTERNSNLSVHIRDNTIADIFKTEFDEMYNYIGSEKLEKGADVEQNLAASDDRFVGRNGRTFPRGRFHGEKRPNTRRIIYYKADDTTARIYFSPTDDGEHRALIPMLHQAGKGDRILISMFGAGGIEYVRAIQLASARGADVNIIVDSPTACGQSQWASPVGPGSLLTESPFKGIYGSDVPWEIHRNDKKSGEIWKQNHQKIGLLLKSTGKPGEFLTRHFAFGSQNWSVTGNDQSDENMVVFSRSKRSLRLATAFQVHFDQFLWPRSLKIESTGCRKVEGDEDDPETAAAEGQ